MAGNCLGTIATGSAAISHMASVVCLLMGRWLIDLRHSVSSFSFAGSRGNRKLMLQREAIIDRVIRQVEPLTMVGRPAIAATIALMYDAIDKDLPGDIVECGTWMGGSSFAMLLAQRYAFGRILKPVWMFDSFEGLPPVDARDGPSAAAWQTRRDAPGHFDNCKAPVEQVKAASDGFGFTPSEAIIVPGWFSDTLPLHRHHFEQRGIALLRVDCDWYDPVSRVLDELGGLVENEGTIILDDYYFWDGCARAVHDYLSRNNLCWRLRTIGTDGTAGAWIIKRPFRGEHQAP